MKRKSVILGYILSFASLFTIIASTLTWFRPSNYVEFESALGYTASSYFAGGDGSTDDPYIINRPVHMYNLAWLQYLGQFNKKEGTSIEQYHFQVDEDVDMSGLVLPPIGTTKNPFIGEFNGNGKTITNLKVSNQIGAGEIVKKPLSVETISDVHVIGMFGVIGDYPSAIDGSFDSSAVSVHDFYAENFEIKSTTSSTLCGIVGGYVDGDISNVGVIDSSINIPNSSTSFGGFTSNVSDFGVVGYCTDDRKTFSEFKTTEIKTPETEHIITTLKQDGLNNGWGGSLDMKSMYDRLRGIKRGSSDLNINGIQTETVNIDVHGNEASRTTNSSYNLNFQQDISNPLKGYFTFSRYQAGTGTDGDTYIYLYGQETFTKTVTYNKAVDTGEIAQASYFRDSNGNYMTLNNAHNGVVNSTNQSNATPWAIDDAGYLYTMIDDENYYLNVIATQSGGTWNPTTTYTISVTTNPSSAWSYNNNLSTTSTEYYRQGWNVAERDITVYLSYDNGWKIVTTAGTLVRENSLVTYPMYSIETTTEVEENGQKTPGTYFPLKVDSSNIPETTNSGYVISGDSFHNTSYPIKSGDIRVSKYGARDISASLGGTNSYNGALDVLTQTSTSNGIVRISDQATANPNTAVRNLTTKSAEELKLEKFSDSRTALGNVFSSDTSNIYGLHFMDASIDINDTIIAPKVRINEVDYENYELPEDCIDFHLKEKGFINFFAGTYFSGNTSFFSLHHIFRDEDTQDIEDIKEITKIYGDRSKPKSPYVYQYSDGTYSDSIPASYTEIFDTSWIKTPGTWVNNAVYYYEVPVNEGEYALGSVPGRDGAYLMYLDIAANALEIDRTSVLERIITTIKKYCYPKGIAIVVNNKTTVNEKDTATVILPSNFSGVVVISRTNHVIDISGSGKNLVQSTYVEEHLTLQRESGPPIEATPESTLTEEIRRLTWIDYNTKYEEQSIITVHTQTVSTDGTVSSISTERTFISTGEEAPDTIKTPLDDDLGENLDVIGNNVSVIGTFFYVTKEGETITIKWKFTYETDEDDENGTFYKVSGYDIIVEDCNSSNIEIKVISYNGNYVFKIVEGTTETLVTGSGDIIHVTQTA